MDQKNISLHCFEPDGHGPCSFFVMSESKSAAVAAIREEITRDQSEQSLMYPKMWHDADLFPAGWDYKERAVNEVAGNAND